MDGPQSTMEIRQGTMRVQIEATATAAGHLLDQCAQQHFGAVAGRLINVDTTQGTFKVGDEVVGYVQVSSDSASASSEKFVVVDTSKSLQKPASMSFQEAASLAISYPKAAAILEHALDIKFPRLIAGDAGAEDRGERRVLVTGVETNLGVALVQVLKSLQPRSKILATAYIKNQYALLQRTVHMMMLGTMYAIDGATPDIMDHLRAATADIDGIDALLDAVTAAADRPELLELLVDEKQYVDCRGQDIENLMGELLPGEDVVALFEKMLNEAAEAFQEVTEPGSCGLAHDR